MTIATTSSWNPDVGDIAEEAFELCGLEMKTGNDIRTARRSLNMLSIEWANKGINLWTVEEASITNATIVASTATYDLPQDTISILEAVIRTDDASVTLQTDYICEPISRPTYAQIPNKLTTGRPTQYYFSRIGVTDVTAGVDRPATVTFWPVPDLSTTYDFVYWRMKRMADVGTSAANTMEIPERFMPALIHGLAQKIAVKKAPDRFQLLYSQYVQLFEEAAEEDRDKSITRMVPDLSYY